MAAKRVRDYKAEERRRNELARARGFTSRGQQRRSIEAGRSAAIAPKRVTSAKTKAAQAKALKTTRRVGSPPAKRFNDSHSIAGQKISKRQMMQDWSTYAAGSPMAEYRPDRAAELGVTRAEYDQAYWNAFLDGTTGYRKNRKRGGSDAMEYWFVTLNEFLEADEYDSKYKL